MVSDYAMTKRFRGAEVYLLADYPVGAGLLAKGRVSRNHCSMTHRIREQARSHKGICDRAAT